MADPFVRPIPRSLHCFRLANAHSIHSEISVSETLVLKLYAHKQRVLPFPKQLSFVEVPMSDVRIGEISLAGK